MASLESLWNRLGVIVKLAEKSPGLGHTALMKYLYFLKEIYEVPLSYDFRLYTYGPFDSDVLDDLSYAVSLKAVQSELVPYSTGYGYKISIGPKADEIIGQSLDSIAKYEKQIDEVTQKFRGYTASDLELVATIFYVKREFQQKGREVADQTLIDRTREIKPRYSKEEIENMNRRLTEILSSINEDEMVF